MAKNYSDATKGESTDYIQCEGTDYIQEAKYRLLNVIMEKVDNGSNIDYIVKLSEVYRNIK